ncbi:MAG: APC family permease [Lachnospiraceae bacterium]
MNGKKLGMSSVVSTGVGLIVATTCLLSIGQGAGNIGVVFIFSMIIACALNMLTAASISELNALMPNLSGGLAQYTLASMGPFPTIVLMVGGYLVCNTLAGSIEATLLGNTIVTALGIDIPIFTISGGLTLILTIANLRGVDMFAKIQNVVAYLLIGSLTILGIVGTFGLGTGQVVDQPLNLTTDFSDVLGMSALAFWLFIGVEYIVPIGKDVKNAKKNVPKGMFISLTIVLVMQIFMVLGFHNYTVWGELSESTAPHLLYGAALLGTPGKIWMAFVAVLASISTLNSAISSLAKICHGMSKLNLMPRVFQKTNSKGAPVSGIILIGGSLLLLEVTGLSSTNNVSFLLLASSILWMLNYIVSHINVIIMRRRLPKAPRSFKLPFGLLIPIAGIVGTSFMIINIDSDPAMRMRIWMLAAVVLVILSVYALVWIKLKMKQKLFKSVPTEDVMAMENNLYFVVREEKAMQI